MQISQDLSLISALLDLGFSILSKGQAYVGLKTLDGVHFINLNPNQIKAQGNIVEKTLAHVIPPRLGQIKYKEKTRTNISNTVWAIHSIISKIHENI